MESNWNQLNKCNSHFKVIIFIIMSLDVDTNQSMSKLLLITCRQISCILISHYLFLNQPEKNFVSNQFGWTHKTIYDKNENENHHEKDYRKTMRANEFNIIRTCILWWWRLNELLIPITFINIWKVIGINWTIVTHTSN